MLSGVMRRQGCCPSPWLDATPAMVRLPQVQQPATACARQQPPQLPGTTRQQHYHSLAGLAAGNVDQDRHPQHLAQHQQLWLAAPKGGRHDAPAVAVEWWESRGWGAGGAWGQLLRAQTRTGAAAPPRPGQPPGPGHTSTRHNQPQAEQAGTTTPLTLSPSLTSAACPPPPPHTPPTQTRCGARRCGTAPPPPPAAAGLQGGGEGGVEAQTGCCLPHQPSLICYGCWLYCFPLKGAGDQQDAWFSQQQQSSSEHVTHPPPAPRLPGPGSGPGCAPAPEPAPWNGGKNCKVRTRNTLLSMGRNAPVG